MCAQYVDDIGIAANEVDQLLLNLRAVFECLRQAGLKLTMSKCHFGATEVDFLGRTITAEGITPQKVKIAKFLSTVKFPKSKKALQRYIGFLNYYRNYIPRLSERLTPFFKLLKTDEKIVLSPELLDNFKELNQALQRCTDLSLKQPKANKQYVLMTDASFAAAGYAIMIEDDPQQKLTSTRKTYAPVAFGSKTFSPTQLKMSIYAKEFLAIYYAFSEFGYILWEADLPTIILTDNQSVTRFFKTKLIPPPLWNACDFVLQFKFTIAHIAGKTNTAADFLSRLEYLPKEKIQLKIRDDVIITPLEVTIQNSGASDEEQVFYESADDVTEDQLWQRKKEAREAAKEVPAQITLNEMTSLTSIGTSQRCATMIDNHSTQVPTFDNTSTMQMEQMRDPCLRNINLKLSNQPFDTSILENDTRWTRYKRNLTRITIQNGLLVRAYYENTGKVTHHQILLPDQLMTPLLESLHGQAHKHPGITKMIQEFRQKYYYPGSSKIIKKWVETCEDCVKNKRIPTQQIRPEMLNAPEFDLGPEDALQIDVVPHLPPSGGYENIITAMDVFSRYLFAYPVTNANAIAIAKVIIDIMTRHAYLPTRIITDLGSVFVSQIVSEVTHILGIKLKHATVKHAQTIGILERTHASLKTALKLATGQFRNQWHKYLPLAILNYNTTYHTSLGCEPTRVFHGRIPYNILDHKFGVNHNPSLPINTDFAEELLRRQELLFEKTQKNIMQSYLKYKAYYDKKAGANPLIIGDYCYVLQPKADTQSTKIPFRDFQWVGPYIVIKVLENNNYIVRRLHSNKSQILHRIRIRKFTPREPIIEKEQEENLESDDSVEIQQDDLYAIAWASDFGDHVFESKRNQIQDDEAIQIIPEPIKENQNDLPTDNSSPENPQIFLQREKTYLPACLMMKKGIITYDLVLIPTTLINIAKGKR